MLAETRPSPARNLTSPGRHRQAGAGDRHHSELAEIGGTTGSTQGDRKLMMPATKAARRVRSGIVRRSGEVSVERPLEEGSHRPDAGRERKFLVADDEDRIRSKFRAPGRRRWRCPPRVRAPVRPALRAPRAATAGRCEHGRTGRSQTGSGRRWWALASPRIVGQAAARPSDDALSSLRGTLPPTPDAASTAPDGPPLTQPSGRTIAGGDAAGFGRTDALARVPLVASTDRVGAHRVRRRGHDPGHPGRGRGTVGRVPPR